MTLRRLAAVALLALLLAPGVVALSQGLQKDRRALLDLKKAVKNWGKAKLGTWTSTGNPCSESWKHTVCADGKRVTKLDLEALRVQGTLPPGLSRMGALETLNLRNNRFHGSIPGSWAARLVKLQVLDLSSNNLSGELPAWDMNNAWPSLITLDLSGNRFYGGLPRTWLGPNRPIRTVVHLHLSNNRLGTDKQGNFLTRDQWCMAEKDPAGNKPTLPSGSGWCPDGKPLRGTVSKLETLDLASNRFDGLIPLQWPSMFPNIASLKLEYNFLRGVANPSPDGLYLPSVLPRAWAQGWKRPPPNLVVTLFPGNDYICSIPISSSSGSGFRAVNMGSPYRIADNQGQIYTNSNPRLCPSAGGRGGLFVPQPSSAVFESKEAVTWTYQFFGPLWGFEVTLWAKDAEGEYWTPIPNWNTRLLRIYTEGLDNFTQSNVAGQGLECTAGPEYTFSCRLTFANIAPASGLSPPNLDVSPELVSAWKLEVALLFMDALKSESTFGELPN